MADWKKRPVSENIEDRRRLPPQLYQFTGAELARAVPQGQAIGPFAPVNVTRLTGGPGAWSGAPLPNIQPTTWPAYVEDTRPLEVIWEETRKRLQKEEADRARISLALRLRGMSSPNMTGMGHLNAVAKALVGKK